MATAPELHNDSVRYLDDEESHEFFDAQARRLLGITGAEFLRRYDAGEYDELVDGPDHGAVAQLVMLGPFGR